jgi:hypothetical protein
VRRGATTESPSMLAALARRWHVVIAALLIIGATEVELKPAVDYYSSVHILFYSPQPSSVPILSTNDQAIPLAGIIQLSIAGTQSEAPTSSASVTLQGEGVYNGFSVLLPNTGGQWSNQFVRPELDVQVTGHNPAAVRRRMAAVVALIDSQTKTRQQDFGVTAQHMISTTQSPSVIDVYEANGSRIRELLAVFVLGLGLMLALVRVLDRWLLARPQSRSGRVSADRVTVGSGIVALRPASLGAKSAIVPHA